MTETLESTTELGGDVVDSEVGQVEQRHDLGPASGQTAHRRPDVNGS
jgi:hypothetical protein